MVAIAAIVLAAAGVSIIGCRQGPDRLVLGFVAPSSAATPGGLPQEPSDALARTLSRALGIRVEIYAFPSAVELIKALGDGQADIAVLSPYAYVAGHEASGSQLLLKAITAGRDGTRSEIVVRSDSGLTSLAQLKGKTFAFSDPASPEGYLFPAAYLVENGVASVQELAKALFAGDDAAALKAVLEGRAKVGACSEGIRARLRSEVPDIDQRLLVVAATPPVPETTVAVRTAMDSSLAERVKQAFLSAVRDQEGLTAWRAITGTDGLEEAQEADYDVIRRMVATLGIDIEVLAER